MSPEKDLQCTEQNLRIMYGNNIFDYRVWNCRRLWNKHYKKEFCFSHTIPPNKIISLTTKKTISLFFPPNLRQTFIGVTNFQGNSLNTFIYFLEIFHPTHLYASTYLFKTDE